MFSMIQIICPHCGESFMEAQVKAFPIYKNTTILLKNQCVNCFKNTITKLTCKIEYSLDNRV
jgi:hypothetical protein